jgi:hypothetical protein
MIEHLTLVIAGASAVGFALYTRHDDRSDRMWLAPYFIGCFLWVLGTVPALMGALGIGR